MSIGDLRKRFVVQTERLVPDGMGGQAASWTTMAEVWGEAVPVSGMSAVAANYDRRFTHVIKLRHRVDVTVTTGMRLVQGSRIFSVRAVTNKDERNRWVEILAEEGGVLG